MARALAFLLIGFVFGGGLGFVLASGNRASSDRAPAMDHSVHMHMHGEALIIEPGETAPTLAIDITPDTAGGWNLHMQTTNFSFTGERSGKAHVTGEGHAHIYVNGEKVARAYGPWFHLDALPDGAVEVEVTLNSNDHRALMVGDVPLSATVSFDLGRGIND
ncbi:MAG: hypothetical protein AAF718_10985 [Pseudomonadota bacterium]